MKRLLNVESVTFLKEVCSVSAGIHSSALCMQTERAPDADMDHLLWEITVNMYDKINSTPAWTTARLHSLKSSVFLWLVHFLEHTVKLFHVRYCRFIHCQGIQFMWRFIRLLNAVKTRVIGEKQQELLITPVLKSGQPQSTSHFIILASFDSFLFSYVWVGPAQQQSLCCSLFCKLVFLFSYLFSSAFIL